MWYLIVVLVFIIGLITFLPSFNLALFGDDWLTLYRYYFTLGPNSDGNSTHFTYFLTPYGPQDIFFGLIHRAFGLNSFYYFVISFGLRFLATLSFVPLVYYITKSKLATLCALLFFSVTTIGLEATNWVFNMPSYLTIFLFNVFLYFYIRSHMEKKALLWLVSSFFFFVTYISQPIRMTGLFPFVLVMEFFFLLKSRNRTSLKKFTRNIASLLIIFLFIMKLGNSFGTGSIWTTRLFEGISTFKDYFGKGRFDLIFYPFATVGGFIIPDIIAPQNLNILRRLSLFKNLLLPSYLFFTFIISLIYNYSRFIKKKYYLMTLLLGAFWTTLVGLLFYYHKDFLMPNQTFLILIGGYFALVAIFFIFPEQKGSANISVASFAALTWTLVSFILPWFWVPVNIIATMHRYVIVSAVGVSILLALIVSLGKTNRHKLILFAGLLILIFIHQTTTNNYLTYLTLRHSRTLDTKIWSTMPYVPEIGKDKDPLIFYFEGDNKEVLFDVIIFGFPAHLAFKQGVPDYKNNTATMDDFNEVISAVTDGASLKRFGMEQKPISIDRIYAMRLSNNVIVDMTTEVRNKLEKIN